MRKTLFMLCLSFGIFSATRAQQSSKDSTQQEYVGKYSFPQGSVISTVTITLENGVLMSVSSAGPSALEKRGDDLYYIIEFKGTAKFNRDSTKKVVGVTIDSSGYHLEGTKIE